MHNCDVIVIGAGIGGLFSAAFLAKEGFNVAVIEQHSVPGGYCSGFYRKDYYFDSVVHFINGCGEGGILNHLLKKLGMEEKIKFYLTDPITTLIYPDFTIEISQDYREFILQLKDRFPKEKEAIDNFFQLLVDFYNEANRRFFGDNSKPKTNIFNKYMQSNFRQLLDQYFSDEKLKMIMNGQLCYSGLPASRVSAVWMGIQLITHHLSGSYYPEGGMQRIADELVRYIKDKGGEVILNEEVIKILDRDSKIIGVRTSVGREILAPVVISNVNIKKTLLEYLSNGLKCGFEHIEKLEPSISAFAAYIGVDMDLKKAGLNGSNYIIHQNTNFEETSRVYAAGNMPESSSIFISIPTLKTPHRNGNKHSLNIISLAPYFYRNGWQNEKEVIKNKFIGIVEDFIPGISGEIQVVDAATPLTLERYTKNWNGAAYGLAMTPEQVFFRRPLNKLRVEGLYLTGHYTFPGLGVMTVARSGYMTAQQVIKDKNKKDR